jgi:hypothetical protein
MLYRNGTLEEQIKKLEQEILGILNLLKELDPELYQQRIGRWRNKKC